MWWKWGKNGKGEEKDNEKKMEKKKKRIMRKNGKEEEKDNEEKKCKGKLTDLARPWSYFIGDVPLWRALTLLCACRHASSTDTVIGLPPSSYIVTATKS